MGHTGVRRGGTGATVLALAGAVLIAGCAGEDAKDSDGKATTVQPRVTPHVPGPRHPSPARSATPPAAPRTPSAVPAALPGQTSSPDPKLPPPRVSMDLAHAAEGGGKAVNLTVDDGPDPKWTPVILKILRDNGARATFCLIGPQAAARPGLVRRIVADGHRLCDHTVTHDTAMDGRSEQYQREQILRAARQIERASGGVKPLYYRAPGGAFTPYSRQIAASAGMRPLGWNADSKDYQEPGVDAILRTVKREMRDGPTLLFHDGGGDRSQTAAALRKLLPWLRHRGYSFAFPEH